MLDVRVPTIMGSYIDDNIERHLGCTHSARPPGRVTWSIDTTVHIGLATVLSLLLRWMAGAGHSDAVLSNTTSFTRTHTTQVKHNTVNTQIHTGAEKARA